MSKLLSKTMRLCALTLTVGYLTLSVTPLSAIAQTAPAAFTIGDNGIAYFNFAIDEDKLGGAPDRSAMNQALDAGSRIFVRNGHFYRVGPDNRPNTADDARVRLYGINLSFSANFPSDADAVRLAQRLRKLGINAVRLHHMDTSPGTQDNPPRSLLTPGPYPTFNPVAVSRLRNFIDALKQQGIYVDLNLHVGYRFRPAVDQLPPLDGKTEATPLGAPIHVYYPRMVALQEDYARQLIRALGLRNNPALAMVEINNESSLLAAWQRREWTEAVPRAYEAELRKQWQEWLVRRYGSTTKACTTWNTCVSSSSVVPLLTPTDASQIGQWRDRLDGKFKSLTEKVLGPTDPGTPNTSGEALRVRDFLLFLADTDRAYFNRLRQVVQSETDALVPVTGTQMGYGGVLNFDSQAQMDYIDEHFYIDHPDFPGPAWDRNDWRIRNSAASDGELNRLLALSLRRDIRKPFVVSEYNQPFPNKQGSEIQPLMAAIGAAQDWDGLFFFDYMDGDNWAATPSAFTLAGDWSKYAATGQSAMLFRNGLVGTLQKQTAIPFGAETRAAVAAVRDPSAFETHLSVRYGVTPELATQARLGMDLSGAGKLDKQTPPATTPLRAANGEFEFEAQQRTIQLRTPQARGFFGFLMKRRVGDDNVAIELLGKSRGFTGVLLTALDNRPLVSSRRILISASSAVTGNQSGSMPPRPKELIRYKSDAKWWTLEQDAGMNSKPSGPRDVEGPVWMERNEARISLRTQAKRISVYPLDGSGKHMTALDGNRASLNNGMATIHIQAEIGQASPWYEVVADE
ncbi:capsular biosynthesis protein [Herbaspirillum lusitanum]|uniref:cellulase family glycosylhydrolase n=1 Tax=Herbaspirillum lusitanum TaxID=213312 RepID=UPI002238DA7E|nr:cellulase family glycosylhydrolase [Herbaspirillum lusitanum]MCW5299726.1 capsular biosynthesis protein [Herbaspirillum lusitanum]